MRQSVKQFTRFAAVGTSTFLVDYVLLMVLSQLLGMDPVLAGAISFTVSLVLNYLLSMKFVFTRRQDISRRRQFGLFVVLSLVALVLNEIIIWIVKLIATMMVTLWNFFSRRRWLDAEGRVQMKGQAASFRKAMRVRWLKHRKRRRK